MRIAIYAIYDKCGKVDDYITYFVQELRRIADTLIVVSNHALSQSEKDRLSEADQIYEREDRGYDAGAFAYVLKKLNLKKELEKYDEAIFLNDSVFGPFYPLEEMFSVMERKQELDFWGIAKRGVSDFDGGDELYPEHIQLYLYVVREKMLHSQDFMDYWQSISEKITDFRSAIINYEFAFTRHFAELGYKWDVYCHIDDLVTDNPKINLSPYHYCSYELVKEKRCPVLKRKLFTGEAIDGGLTDKSDLRKAVSFIEHYTEYDCDLIWQHILRVYPIGDVIDSMQMYEVLAGKRQGGIKENMAVRIIDNYGSVIQSINQVTDVVVDESAEYTFFVSLKEDNTEPHRLYCAQRDCVVENLFADKAYVSAIVELFEKNPRLGVIIPPINTFGKIKHSIRRQWQNAVFAENIAQKFGLKIPIKQDAPIHIINAFWCRSNILDDALIKELKGDNTGTVMQMIPLFAQQKGYYTKVSVNLEYIAGYLTNLQGLLRDILDISDFVSDQDGNDNMNMEQMQDAIYRQRIAEFIQNKEHVYVYGAGQLACRVVKIMGEIRKPDGIVVSDTNGNAGIVCGCKVMCVDEIVHNDCSFIVAVGKKNNQYIEKKLRDMGQNDYLLLK